METEPPTGEVMVGARTITSVAHSTSKHTVMQQQTERAAKRPGVVVIERKARRGD